MDFLCVIVDPLKHQLPSLQVTYRGCEEVWSHLILNGVIFVSMELARLEDILSAVEEALTRHHIGEDDANSLRSQLIHSRCCFAGRTLHAPLTWQPGPLCEELRSQLLYFRHVLLHGQSKDYMFDRSLRRRVVCWADASFSADCAGRITSRVCCLLHTPSRRYGAVYDIPAEWWAQVPLEQRHVTTAEALVGFLVCLHAAADLKHVDLLWFIDNLAALSGHVHGVSKVTGLCAIYMTTSNRMSVLHCAPWLEYVASKSNVADGGSMTGVLCEIAASLGFHLSSAPWPDSPQLEAYRPHEWEQFWMQQN